MDKITNQELTQTIRDNVASLEIPELRYLMIQYDYRYFRDRALAGEDVYAYLISRHDTSYAYNVWDTDIRIPYTNKPMKWRLESLRQCKGDLYNVIIQNLENTITTELMIVTRWYHGNADRIKRHVLAYVQHCNVFGNDPISEDHDLYVR